MTAGERTDPDVRSESGSSDARARLLSTFSRLHNRWLGGRHNPGAGPPMLCFTYAGGSTAAFHGWEDVLPVNVRPVVLPGRDGRLGETAYTRLTPLISDLADHIGPQITRETVLFGHSMGALVSFELTRELRRRKLPLPSKLLLSAFRAPHLDSHRKPIHHWPDEVLRAVLRKEGVPAATLANSHIMEALLPTLRADLELCDTYEYADEEPLAIPLVIFGGTEDVRVRAVDLQGWDRHSSAGASHVTVNGPHLFINVSRDELLVEVRRELRKAVGE